MGKRSITKFACLLLCALLLLGRAPGVFADTAYDTQTLIDSILSYILEQEDVSSLQDWADGALAEGAGSSSEWYAIALRQYDASVDLSVYGASLKKFLSENSTASAVTKEKYALALLAAELDKDVSLIGGLADTVGGQGLMGWIYGLHLLNNGLILDGHTSEEIVSTLLSAQLADGGWAIMGEYGDVDVTAMTLQALAPYYDADEWVHFACDRALNFLSGKQLDDGDFPGFNGPNPESTAQVLMALCALSLDPRTDSRFIKNNVGIVDGLLQYRLDNGSFCHALGEGSDTSATVQTFCALVALHRFEQGLGSLYMFADSVLPSLGDLPLPSSTPADSSSEAPLSPALAIEEADAEAESSIQSSYKLWAIGGICLLSGIWCLVLLIKKRKAKYYIFVGGIAALLIVLVLLTEVSSPETYYAPPPVKEDAVGQVTLTIRCDTVAGQAEHIPENGVILPETVFDIREGDSVYTILTEAAQTYGIQIDNQGSENLVYIAGLGFLYEFDFGQYSGWVYHVNEETPGVGAGEYILSDGDAICWLYTCNLGQDVEK